jgi:hypothetical protein
VVTGRRGLRRLANPFWFQSFGAVMGMDWHSSGITTSVIGALKRGLTPLGHELGIHVCGGRGNHSRRTPQELISIGDRVGVDGPALAKASRLAAKVDSAAVQDGFDLYLHGFIVTDDGKWTVVQQGVNGGRKQARRYHWLSEGLTSFVDNPHAAIEGAGQGEIINLADRRAEPSRLAQIDLLASLLPNSRWVPDRDQVAVSLNHDGFPPAEFERLSRNHVLGCWVASGSVTSTSPRDIDAAAFFSSSGSLAENRAARGLAYLSTPNRM